MGTMNVSLPDALKKFVDDQVLAGDYASSSEYVRELLRRERDRLQLRSLVLEGANSPIVGEASTVIESLRQRVKDYRAS